MPSIRQTLSVAALVALPFVVPVACSKNDTPAPELQPRAGAAETPPTPKPKLACALVTQAEMSKILGTAVTAEPHGTPAETKCIYRPVTGTSPYVEFSVNWGDGEVAMSAMGSMINRKPAIASPYDGIGDQAIAAGSALMIRTGEDLVQLVFSGVSDAPRVARQIFDTAKPRM
jgi:hypothetical protein